MPTSNMSIFIVGLCLGMIAKAFWEQDTSYALASIVALIGWWNCYRFAKKLDT